MRKLSLPTIFSIITWANDAALINNVMFLRGNKALPYIQKGSLFYYFTKVDQHFELQMESIHDLEAFA